MEPREIRKITHTWYEIEKSTKRMVELMELFLSVRTDEETKERAAASKDLSHAIKTATEFEGMTLTKTERSQIIEYLRQVKAARG